MNRDLDFFPPFPPLFYHAPEAFNPLNWAQSMQQKEDLREIKGSEECLSIHVSSPLHTAEMKEFWEQRRQGFAKGTSRREAPDAAGSFKSV